MRILFIIFTYFVLVASVFAYTPVVVTQESLHDIVDIKTPEISRTYYGEMKEFPHTYEIRSSKPFHLYAQILIPDIESSKNNVNGIIIKETTQGGRVEEVARFLAKDALWESDYEPWGGDSYRVGGTFEADVAAGVYRIEVSTPDNLEKYVLTIGKDEDPEGLGYFEMLGRISEVKTFFEKPKIFLVQSPYVYIPLLVLSSIGVWWYRRKKIKNNQQSI